jgi:hypothetical protein
MSESSGNVNIYGTIYAQQEDGKAAYAEQVYDEEQDKFQDEINAELNAKIDESFQHQVYLRDEDSTTPIPSFDPQADTLHKAAQVLSNAEKKQVRQNIGLGNGDIDSVPTNGSHNIVESSGVYKSLNLCNITEVNDFVVDIVLKEGVEIDFNDYDRLVIRCFNHYGSKYQNGISLGSNTATLNLIWNSYDSLNDAKAGIGVLVESDYCYAVLRNIGIYNRTINKTISLNRDISWASLNEHPIIKELLIEKNTLGSITQAQFDAIFDN